MRVVQSFTRETESQATFRGVNDRYRAANYETVVLNGWYFPFVDLLSTLALAIVFIYLILASQFASFTQPVAIMASLPFSLIGVLLGSWAAYWLARALGRATVRKLMGKHAVRIEQRLESRGLLAVFMLRLMPGIPYWPVNYGSGAFGVSQRDYLVASALSVIPGQLSLVAIGSFIAVPNVFNGVVIGISWIMVGVLTIWAYLRWRRQPVPAAPVAS